QSLDAPLARIVPDTIDTHPKAGSALASGALARPGEALPRGPLWLGLVRRRLAARLVRGLHLGVRLRDPAPEFLIHHGLIGSNEAHVDVRRIGIIAWRCRLRVIAPHEPMHPNHERCPRRLQRVLV